MEPGDSFTDLAEKISKNKINKSNAFENRIIDEVSEIITTQLDWQKYTVGLDSCAKIYAFCVDSIFTDALQIMSRLGFSKDKEKDREEKEEKLRKKSGFQKTLEKEENFTLEKIEKIEHENCFERVSKTFNATCYKGQILNNVSIGISLDFEILDQDGQADEIMTNDEPVNFESIQIDTEQDLINQIESYLDKKTGIYIEPDVQMIDEEIIENIDSEGDNEKTATRLPLELQENLNFDQKLQNFEQFNDYKFINNVKKNDWAGLEFWKKNNLSDKTRSIKKKKEFSFALDPFFNKTKEQVFARSYAFTSQTEKKISDLPENFNYSVDRFTRLWTKPVRRNLERPEDPIVDQEFYLPESSLKTEKGSKSKVVDIANLKSVIWSSLNVPENKENFEKKKKKNKFLDIIKHLPKQMPANVVENLSVHTCFISLLHLANEKNLLLQPDGHCDFFIDINK